MNSKRLFYLKSLGLENPIAFLKADRIVLFAFMRFRGSLSQRHKCDAFIFNYTFRGIGG